MIEMFSRVFQREIIQVFLLYFVVAAVFYIALVIDTGWYYHFEGVSLNFLFKGLLTIPIWWLIFRKLALVPFWKKLLVHFITLPVFTVIWMWIYYMLCDYLGIRRAQGNRVVWDGYITALFYTIQFGFFHLSDYYKKLKEEQLLTAQLSELNLQSELSALKAQLNPHFLYNVFNTINAAIPNTAGNARDMVTKLSDLFRYQLKASREELVMLREELDFVRKYLELEKERFGDRLLFEIDMDIEVLEIRIPPMIIQPIIENAVKHGISPLIEGGKITVEANLLKELLEITVSDTGIGISNQKKSDLLNRGIGLSNTDERLKKMYGRGVDLRENTPRGLIVKIVIPLSEKINGQ